MLGNINLIYFLLDEANQERKTQQNPTTILTLKQATKVVIKNGINIGNVGIMMNGVIIKNITIRNVVIIVNTDIIRNVIKNQNRLTKTTAASTAKTCATFT